MGLSGLASGFDWRTLVDQLQDVERSPQRRMVTEQQGIQTRKVAYESVSTQLSVLQNRVAELNDPTLFDSRLAKASDEYVATVSAQAGAALGSYAFQVDQLATASARQGSSNIGSALSTTTDVTGVVLGTAPLSTAVTAGTFTINGQQVTVATTDTLQGVFNKISAATGADVTGSYNPTTDRITLTSGSSSEVVLGSATDTTNFLQVTRLSNNGTNSITSSAALGAVRLSGALTSANLVTTITDGGSGAGKFKINGVEISFIASTDSISDVLKRINDSTAGVTASYDTVNDRFLLTNKITGNLGVAVEDVTGNFLAATGLSSGSLQRGKDLLYTVNGGGQMSSHSNTISQNSSGIEGLSVTFLKEGASATITVSSDTAKIKKAVTDFVDAYNKSQAIIDTNTASTTDAKGKVTAGTLAGESEAYTLSADLRRMVTATFSSLSGTIRRLEGLGITSNGNDDKLTVSDSAQLESAILNRLGEVRQLFTNSTDGLAVKLGEYLENAVGEDGTLPVKKNNLDKQILAITTQIAEQEKLVQLNRSQLIASFVAMETAQQSINQQLQYLSKVNGR